MILTILGFFFCVFMALWTNYRKQPKSNKAAPMTDVAPVAPMAHHSIVQRVEALVTAAATEVGKVEAFVAAEVEKVAAPLRADLAAAEAQVAKLEGVITALADKLTAGLPSRAQDTAIAAAGLEAALPLAAAPIAAAAAKAEAIFTAADAPGAVTQ
jgi:hypothetical protein